MDMFFLDFVVLFMFLSGICALCSVRNHLLLCLLSLEYLILVLFFSMFIFFSFWGDGEYFVIYYLSFSVCESVLGLALLVSMVRCHGNDNLSSLSMLSW